MRAIFKGVKELPTLKNLLIFIAWLVPIIISFIALRLSQRALRNSEKENLFMQVVNYLPGIPQPFSDYPVHLHSVLRSKGELISEPKREEIEAVFVDNYWSCLISNLGLRTVSIIAFEVWRNGSRDLEKSGFFEEPDKPLDLPIIIAPGESRQLLLRVSIRLGDKAIDTLFNQRKLDYNLMSNDLFSLLWSGTGIDLYGNPVRLIRFGEGYAGFSFDKNPFLEYFELKIKTGMAKYFADKFTYYKTYKF